MVTCEYKTIYCNLDDCDSDLNTLAKEGWRVQSFDNAWVDIDEDGGHMPWMTYLLVRQVDDGRGEEPVPAAQKPERRVIGRSG